MKVICGLGNPGEKYQRTRHNAGFRVLDALAEKWEAPAWEVSGKRLQTVLGKGSQRVFLIKPLTFMNLSGEAVSEILQFYKIEPKDLTVIFDDVDLPLGSVRYREKGSAGTHNGMRSIVQTLASLDFPRVKIGIESRGVTAPEKMPLDAFVLAPFTEEEEAKLKDATAEAIKIVEKSLA